ncbi:hypothetical protein NDU88_000897 [Pleurodeles waltl]|uniref:Uncharacterized protein n=1 Tax=Pleurodeles waltl TaxID=8319 RepID=A0AAV7TGR3_PLEWA|nr:hypothetical protein NDU88_000897 [Pleurodeles waltl]
MYASPFPRQPRWYNYNVRRHHVANQTMACDDRRYKTLLRTSQTVEARDSCAGGSCAVNQKETILAPGFKTSKINARIKTRRIKKKRCANFTCRMLTIALSQISLPLWICWSVDR